MWTLWFIPLLGLIFLGMAVVAIIAGLIWRPKRPVQWIGLAALPFGCATLPLLVLMLLAAINTLLHESDAGLFEEIWGFLPEMQEDQMLSDDFGIASDRWIYMRMEPSAHDRQRLIDVTRPSAVTAEQFEVIGQGRQFSWWTIRCDAPVMRQANGYRGWQMLILLDCGDRQPMWMIAHRP